MLSHPRRGLLPRLAAWATLGLSGALGVLPAAVAAPAALGAPAALDAPAATAAFAATGVAAVRTPGAGGGPAAGVTAGLPARPDPARRDQWQLRELDAETAWRYATGQGVVVGVLDSGVDARHPDLAGRVLPGHDLVTPGRDGHSDPVGHGTTVAGLIVGSAEDDRGAVGLAPGARILPVRVLDADNRYDDAMIVAQGVRWAVDHGATVLNLSLGGVGTSPALAAALDDAFTKDVVVIACTGNLTATGSTEVWYPAREPGVIAVSGLDHEDDDRLWENSIHGAATVVSAPATSLLGARPGGYWRVQGTSFAAPLVTATAALIRSRWPGMSAANVVNRIIRTARDVGPTGRDESYGFGAVDPVAALTRDVPVVDRNPLDTLPSPGLTGFGTAPGYTERGGASGRGEQAMAGGGAARVAGGGSGDGSGGLLGAMAAFLVLVTGGVLVIRRLDRPPW